MHLFKLRRFDCFLFSVLYFVCMATIYSSYMGTDITGFYGNHIYYLKFHDTSICYAYIILIVQLHKDI